MTPGDDHSTIRTGFGPQVIAALRSTALTLLRLAGHATIARARRHVGWPVGLTLQSMTAA